MDTASRVIIYYENFVSTNMVKLVWVFIAIIFFLFSIFYFIRSTRNVPKFISKGHVKAINGIPLGYAELIIDFNEYIDGYNRDNRAINCVAGVGYLVTAATALVSGLLY